MVRIQRLQFKYLWCNLKYAYYDWRNKVRVSRFNESILVKNMVSNWDFEEKYNPDEAVERNNNAQEYYKANSYHSQWSTHQLKEKANRLVYKEDGTLVNQDGAKVDYRDAPDASIEFQKWYNSLPK